MAKATRRAVTAEVSLDELFHRELWHWYAANRREIRSNYDGLTQRFLDYNAPLDSATPRFLRQPQSEALEIYVFLKERMLQRRPNGEIAEPRTPAAVHDIFERWYRKETPFARRADIGMSVDRQQQLAMGPRFAEDAFVAAFKKMKEGAGSSKYANYIFALTMGTGKTLLMLTCIFYDFLMADRYPEAKHYAHNALIFAPDLTVLQTLRQDIEQFDRERVVPREYLHVLDAATPHFLSGGGETLQGLSQRFNIVVSNAQKIILRRSTKPRGPVQLAFEGGGKTYRPSALEARAEALLDTPEIQDEEELITNQRYETLRRMKQLGVFIDEAHHAYGNALLRDLNPDDPNDTTSLRNTVNKLYQDLKTKGTRVVGCYNFTGTPYANGQVFPEVVYAYGLKTAIDNKLLKDVEVITEDEQKVMEASFITDAIDDFMKHHQGKRYEGMLPKLAIFGPSKDVLRGEIYTAVVKAIAKHGLTARSVVVNVEDSGSEEIHAFNLLDTPESDKQFILLVGKGREGWNCRSLFGVALYRKPRSKVFVLQATMRCLRAIDQPPQRTGRIYLSKTCKALLDEEMLANYKLTVDELKGTQKEKKSVDVRPVKPIPHIKIVRVRTLHEIRLNANPEPPEFEFSDAQVEKYRVIRERQQGLRSTDDPGRRVVEEIVREHRAYTALTLCAEISRYLGKDWNPIEVEEILRAAPGGIDETLRWVNLHNDLLYDYVIPKLFHRLYKLTTFEHREPDEVALVREPPGGAYTVRAEETKIVSLDDHSVDGDRSFHLDHYCFDSNAEKKFFEALLREKGRVRKVYFTGMLTHGQTDFFIDYVDPVSAAPRHYYPDFLVQLDDGDWIVFEVKADNEIEDEVVKAKERFARELLDASRMSYRFVPSSHVDAGRSLEYLDRRPAQQRLDA